MADPPEPPEQSTGNDPFMTAIVISLLALGAAVLALAFGMSGKDLLHWAGELLLVIGISLAAWGISDVRREWTQLPGWRGILGKHLRTARHGGVQRLWRVWNTLAARRLLAWLGARPHVPQTVSIEGGMVLAKLGMTSELKVGWAPAPDDGTIGERLAWLEAHLMRAGEQLDMLDAWRRQESKERKSSADQERADRIADVQITRASIANLAGGGLRLQAWGVACLLIGTALTAFYP